MRESQDGTELPYYWICNHKIVHDFWTIVECWN